MDIDYESMHQLDQPTDDDEVICAAGQLAISSELGDIVESIYNENMFPGALPDSPPDSGSEHLVSPDSSSILSQPRSKSYYPTSDYPFTGVTDMCLASPEVDLSVIGNSGGIATTRALPDLSKVNYTMPLKMIESFNSANVVDVPSIILPRRGDFSAAVRYRDKPRQQDDNIPPHKRHCTEEDMLFSDKSSLLIKREPSSSPESTSWHWNNTETATPTSIQFSPLFPDKWNVLVTSRLTDLTTTKQATLQVTADKGFNFSTQDDAFIVQKKNHFQVSCHVCIEETPSFVRGTDGTLRKIAYLQLNFYGVKSDAPTKIILIEQSQADRTKRTFPPMRLEFGANNNTTQVTAGRLHFAETTSNNMRKKGKPNPAQKYFQFVVALQAVEVDSNGQMHEHEVIQMASDRVIVRASNPGQFEFDNEPLWNKDPGTDTMFHIGRVAINTEKSGEALTVHGNLQVSGQILQPSDARLKEVLCEVDSSKQLDNVNKIKIVKYQYKPEFVRHLPEMERSRMVGTPHTGVIAQDLQQVLPDAVSTNGPCMLSNGVEIDNMLIVNKDRLFLENIGAVRELSKRTGHLGHRLEDLEKANESVVVRLARLKRGSSVTSSSSTSSTCGSTSKKHTSPRTAKTLFQNRCIQMFILVLIAIIAVSMVAMATVYIINTQNRSDDVIEEHIQVIQKQEFVSLVPVSTTTKQPPPPPPSIVSLHRPKVLGALSITDTKLCQAQSDTIKCKSYCCGIDPSTTVEYNILHINDTTEDIDPQINKAETSTSTPTPTPTPTPTSTIEDVEKKLPKLYTQETKVEANQVPYDKESSPDEKTKPVIKVDDQDKEDKDENKVIVQLNKVSNNFTNDDDEEDENEEEELNEVFLDDTLEKLQHNNGSNNNNETTNDLVWYGEAKAKDRNDVFDKREEDLNLVVSGTKRLSPTDKPQQHQQQQRAKRGINDLTRKIGHLMQGLIRRIRDTDHHPVVIHDSLKKNNNIVLVTSCCGNVSLDETYCDSLNKNECFSNYNISLAIPLSRHFSDQRIGIQLPAAQTTHMCHTKLQSECQYDANKLLDDQVSNNGSSSVFVGTHRQVQVRFRYTRQGQPSRNDLCNLSSNKFSFYEVNLRFYRVCDQ